MLANRNQTTSLRGAEDRVDVPVESLSSTSSPQGENPDKFRFATREHFSSWFPGADPDQEVARTFRTWSSKRTVILATCCVVSSFVFVVNLTTTIVFKTSYKSDSDLGTLYHGDCGTSSRLSTGLHLVINLLSTLLIGSSNFCMQLLAAPTRAEVDKAHKEHRWLDIGVPSIRNLKSIAFKRRVLWAMLGLSSVPLHFL